MSNMSYCRFSNTLGDLKDCAEALFDGDELSNEEERAKKQLVEVCCGIAESFGGMSYDDD